MIKCVYLKKKLLAFIKGLRSLCNSGKFNEKKFPFI